MNKKCVNCPNVFLTTIKTRNKKYCDVCKIIVWKKQKKEYGKRRYSTTRIECDLFCTKCFEPLPIGSHNDRRYCDGCLIKRKRNMKMKNYNIKKLDLFYKNLRINLMNNPYLVERRKMELLIGQ